MQTPEMSPQPRVRLTEARLQQGFSQQEIAEQIGTTYVNVSRWERGITKPSPYFRRKLSTLFGRSEAELELTGRAERAEGKAKQAEVTSQMNEASASVVDAIYDPSMPLPPAIPLIGREQDLDRIKQRLFGGASVALTALNGLPGVGKTALSIALAHDAAVRAHFRDGVLWAGLGPTPNMPGLLGRWGTLLGISAAQMATLSSNEAWARAIRSAIGARKMLLVIDDAWRLEEALTFRVGGPNCSHLVTTRFPNIAAHMTIDGATLIEELNEEQSIRLLNLLAPQAIQREEQRVHDLVQAVGGLPLALTLIGNYLRKQAYSGPARRISAALERLSDAEVRLQISEPHVPVESHPSLPVDISLSLQSVIAVTDQLLNEAARRALYALSLFPPKPNTFSEEAALAIAACTTDELDSLCDAGLLESNGIDRYYLHQVIADYAQLQRQADGGEQNAYQRLVAYITDYVETHKKEYELLELESSTIQMTLEVMYAQGRLAELVKAVCAFAPFLILRGFYVQAEQHLVRAHEAAERLGDEYGIAGTLLYRGEVARKQGKFAQAEQYFQEGLVLAKQIKGYERICSLLNNLGLMRWHQGDFSSAESFLQEGLLLARQIEDREKLCSLLRAIGSVVGSRGDHAQAATYFKEGLENARQIDDREQICFLLSNLGVAVGGQGNHAQATTYFQEGLTLARQIGHREQICALLGNLGEALEVQGQFSQAKVYFQEGLSLAKQLEHREWTSIILINLGVTSRKQGDAEQAEIFFQEGLSFAREIGRPQITAHALYEYGNFQLEQDSIEKAASAFREVYTMVPKGNQELLALTNYGLARIAAKEGNKTEALKLGKESFTVLQTMNHKNAQEVQNWLASVL